VILLMGRLLPLGQAPVPEDHSGKQRGSRDNGDDLENGGVVLRLRDERQQTCSKHVKVLRQIL
jgi:hypothetical protein